MDFASTQTFFAEALLDANQAIPDIVTTARGGIGAARFAVYRNNVFVALTKALARNFPVTERLVGTDFFAAMARTYAQDHKPASPLMFEYGRDFPDFIASFPPASTIAYLSDVARLEGAWMRSYNVADAVPLDLATLAALPPETLADLRLALHPSAGLIRSEYPVGSIWSAHQQELVMPVADWQPETVLVIRPAMTVNVHILPPQDTVFATALLNRATLGEAAASAFVAAPAFDFGKALIGLVGLGAFSALQLDEGNVHED